MKWYVGVQKPHSKPRVGIVFPYSGKVIERKFGALMGYVFGGYSSKEEALNVANYQGFIPVLKTYDQVKSAIIHKINESYFAQFK